MARRRRQRGFHRLAPKSWRARNRRRTHGNRGRHQRLGHWRSVRRRDPCGFRHFITPAEGQRPSQDSSARESHGSSVTAFWRATRCAGCASITEHPGLHEGRGVVHLCQAAVERRKCWRLLDPLGQHLGGAVPFPGIEMSHHPLATQPESYQAGEHSTCDIRPAAGWTPGHPASPRCCAQYGAAPRTTDPSRNSKRSPQIASPDGRSCNTITTLMLHRPGRPLW